MNPNSFKKEGNCLSWLLKLKQGFFFKPQNKNTATTIKQSAVELASEGLMLQVCMGYT